MIIYILERAPEDGPEIYKFEQFNRGLYRPYLGSGTSEKRSGAVINYPKIESFEGSSTALEGEELGSRPRR